MVALAVAACSNPQPGAPSGEVATSGDDGAPPAERTLLASRATFWSCIEEDRPTDGSLTSFTDGGIDAVDHRGDRAVIGGCLERSGYDRHLTPEGEEILDDDMIMRLNDLRRMMKQCLEDADWYQDELVFDEQGLLVPAGEGPTLSDSELPRYQEASKVCNDRARELIESWY